MKSLSRRDVLQVGVTVLTGGAVATLLAACGGQVPASSTSSPATSAQPIATPTVTAGTSGAPISSSAQTTKPAAQASSGSATGATVRYYQFMNSEEDVPIWKGGIDRFNKHYPNVKIQHEYAPWGDYWQKLTTEAAAGSQADAILMVTMYTHQYGTPGVIQPLDSYAKADPTSHLEDQWAPIKQANSVKGHWPMQLEYDLSTICVYINKNLFKKAGVPDPTEKLPDYWTFDEFAEAATRLTTSGSQGKQWGVLGRLDLFSTVPGILESYGGGFINQENTKCILDDPTNIPVLQKIADLYVKNKVAPTPAESGNIPLFESGRVAMNFGNPEVTLRYRNRIKDFEWDVAPLPVSPETKKKRNWVHGGGLSMGGKTKVADQAWTFINFYMSADNLAEMVGKTSRGIPGRPSVANSLLQPSLPPKHNQLFLDAVNNGTCSWVTNFDQLTKILRTASDEMYTGAKPAADIVKEVVPQVNDLLKV